MRTTRSQLLSTILVAVIAAFVSTMVTMHTFGASPRNIRVRSLSLVDDSNHEVATLSTNHGAPELALFDQSHKKRGAFFLEGNSTPDIYLYDNAGIPRAALNLLDSGEPNLAYGGLNANDPFASSSSPTGREFRLSLKQVVEGKLRVLGVLELSAQGSQPQLRLLDGGDRVVWQSSSQRTSKR